MSRSQLLLGTSTEREMATRMGQTRISVGVSALVTTGLAQVVFGVKALLGWMDLLDASSAGAETPAVTLSA